jgi:hypothetical protein
MPGVITWIRNTWQRYRGLQGAQSELATFGMALVFALFLLPPIIWLAGRLFLGEYTRDPTGQVTGGPLALWIDFLRGLAEGSPGHWLALLGPYVILIALRVSRRLLKM